MIKMTENKRYRISQGYNDRFCHDWKKNKLFNFQQTVDLLNEQDNRIKELKNENKQLKIQLQTDDICSKCKHEYLIKQYDGYFIAKCKKAFSECSTGDVTYCKDFELKDDSDIK